MPLPSSRGSQRGFTLVELMTVVVLVGILAGLAVFGVRRYIQSAKTSEAVTMMTSIKSAEEAFKDETFVYLDVSETFAAANFYPTTTPVGGVKTMWGADGSNAVVAGRFRTLGVQPDAPVMFGYAVVACGPGGNGSCTGAWPVGKSVASFNFPSANSRWGYVVVAKCNVSCSTPTGCGGKETRVVSHSYSNEVYVENEGE